MKTFSISAPWDAKSTLVSIEIGKHTNNTTSIRLIDVNDNQLYAVATIKLSNVLLLDNEVLIHDHLQNEGMLDFLTTNNIVTPTGKLAYIAGPDIDVPVCILNPESEWGMIPNLYSDEAPEYDSAGFTENDNNTMPPPPIEIDMVTGKSMWLIKDYKIWATTYQEALKHLDMIESF